MSDYLIAAFYKFVGIGDPVALRESLLRQGEAHGLCGTILVAEEGINSTVAAQPEQMRAFLKWLTSLEAFHDLEWKESEASEQPFYRFKVRLKKEIVTLGQEGVSPVKCVGEYVEPQNWNALISDPEVLLIDTRNDYEYALGTFERAEDPHTDSFRQFPDYVQRELADKKHKKVAMFCTGGIRCEKATAYMLEQGFEHVYHLKGGILKYLEEVPQQESLWRGECFVFDNRVSVDHQLQPGDAQLCFGCRHPLTDADRSSPQYEPGVQCPNCYGRHDEARLFALRERQRQVRLARERGEQHIGIKK